MIGDKISVNGVDLVILDYINGNPFVWAYGFDIETKFSDKNTNYKGSILQKKVDNWFDGTGISAIEREVDLTAMDGCTKYGKIVAKVAPLTFDEYRKYAGIIKENVEGWFWTVTPWGDPDEDTWASNYVCVVNDYGGAYYSNYSSTSGRLAPAFILDKSAMKAKPKTLADFTTEELLVEISKRVK